MSRVLITSVAVATITLLACSASPTDDDTASTIGSALSSDCPENRNFSRYQGPASWPSRYGVEGVCVASRYDCRMPTPDSDFRRYLNPHSSEGTWPVAMGIPVLDGRGHPIGSVTVPATKINWGQRKRLDGKEHVYAFSVGSGDDDVSGWVPAACIGWSGKNAPSASCTQSTKGTPADFAVFSGRRPTAKYDAIKKYKVRFIDTLGYEAACDSAKIVCNAPDEPHRSMADYVPRLSADKQFYKVNLLANVPGMSPAVGGIAADTFRVAHVANGQMVSDGLTFHRLVHVKPIVVYLFKAKSTESIWGDRSALEFFYGYITYDSGGGGWARRYGWIPSVALE